MYLLFKFDSVNGAMLSDLSTTTVKLPINVPGVYLTMDRETPAFNRDPAFIGDPASIRTLSSSLRLLLLSFVPMFPLCVNFTPHVNSQRLALSVGGSCNITSVWLVL